jgi:hypothetical protein
MLSSSSTRAPAKDCVRISLGNLLGNRGLGLQLRQGLLGGTVQRDGDGRCWVEGRDHETAVLWCWGVGIETAVVNCFE